MSDDTTTPEPPVIKVTSGNPNADEVAALTVLLSALGTGNSGGEPNLRRGWARPSRRFGGAVASSMGWGRRH